MQSEENASSLFHQIQENPYNKSCFECDKPNPNWASINNGILICLKCCGLHKELNAEFSLIKALSLEELTPNDIAYLKTGGNGKLKNFFEGFNIMRNNFAVKDKYRTKAAIYYRALLKNLVEGGELPDPPSLNEGSQLEIIENEEPPKEIEAKGWGFSYFQTAKSLLGTAVEKTSLGLSKVNEKIKESHLKENIVNIGSQVIHKSKEIGSDVYEKSKVVGTEVFHKSREIGSEILVKTKDLSHEAVVKSKEYGKIISEKSIAFGTQVAEKSKEIGQEVVKQTKKGYDQVSKSLNQQKEEGEPRGEEIHFEEMKEMPPEHKSDKSEASPEKKGG